MFWFPRFDLKWSIKMWYTVFVVMPVFQNFILPTTSPWTVVRTAGATAIAALVLASPRRFLPQQASQRTSRYEDQPLACGQAHTFRGGYAGWNAQRKRVSSSHHLMPYELIVAVRWYMWTRSFLGFLSWPGIYTCNFMICCVWVWNLLWQVDNKETLILL